MGKFSDSIVYGILNVKGDLSTDGKIIGESTASFKGDVTAPNFKGVATKVSSNLVLRLNGGTSEGTNQITFNGEGAKTLNITPASIGAHANTWKPSWSDITGKPSEFDPSSHTHPYLPLDGGTMRGNIIFGESNGIVQNQQSTSNYTRVVSWMHGGTKLRGQIGSHNTGGSGEGSIIILPYETATEPWVGSVGLFIAKDVLKIDNKVVWHSGNFDPNGKLNTNANAVSASKLVTPRTINGTNFDGSANITTANWGTTRRITIGNTAKDYNGGENVSWGLSEIGAEESHVWQAIIKKDVWSAICQFNVLSLGGKAIITVGHTRGSVVVNTMFLVSWGHSGNGSITMLESHGYTQIKARLMNMNGNDVRLEIYDDATGTSGAQYAYNCKVTSLFGSIVKYTAFTASSGTQVGETTTTKYMAIKINNKEVYKDGYHPNADTLSVSRTLTIGNSGKSFNGGSDVSWSLSEIGAAPSSHTHTFASLTDKPTTLSGYGITDASPSNHTHSYLPLSGGSLTGALTIYGTKTSNGTAMGLYNPAHNNIILKGSASNGMSGIFFESSKGDSAINHPSDYAFIQFQPYGPTEASGESNRLVIGVANDPGADKVVIQVPGPNDFVINYQAAGSGVDKTERVIWHGGNFDPATKQNSANRGDWNTKGVINNVVGQLAWKHYSSNHTIFDASNSTTPSGTSCNNVNPDVYWSSTYPTLMGWNGSQTYGVRVDNARNSDLCSGLAVHGGRNNESNKLVRTDVNGYLQVGYINSSSGNENNNSNPDRVWGTNGSDDFLRTYRTSALSVDNSAKLGGVLAERLKPKVSLRNFEGGTLIRTSINYAASSGAAWLLKIHGNVYGNGITLNLQAQGYIYSDTIINTNAIYYGTFTVGSTTALIAMNLGGYLCFWFGRQGYWAGYNVECYNVSSDDTYSNLVTSIEDSGDPGGTKRVDIPLSKIYHSGDNNIGTSSTNYAAGNHTHNYLPLGGGTLDGALNFKNGTWNMVGDDVYIGDINVAGQLGIKAAQSVSPGLAFYNSANTAVGNLISDNGTLKWSNQTVYHSGNCNSSAVNWSAANLTLGVNAIISASAHNLYFGGLNNYAHTSYYFRPHWGSAGNTEAVINIQSANTAGVMTTRVHIRATESDSYVQANRFVSTVGNGTAPLSVSSNTIVSNLNADMVDGLHIHTGRNNEANRLVRTDGSGYLQVGYINSDWGNENNNSNPDRVWGSNATDGYLRTYRTSALDVGSVGGWTNSNLRRNLGSSNYKTFTIGGSSNTYYPVIISRIDDKYSFMSFSISRDYAEKAPNDWNTSTHKGGLSLTLDWNSSTYWDGNGQAYFVRHLTETYCTMVSDVDITTGGLLVWLRGGGADYHIHSLRGVELNVSVYLGAYTDAASRTFSPRLDTPKTNLYPRYAVRGADLYDSGNRVYSGANSNIGYGATNYAAGNHTHSNYLSTSGGTINGGLTVTSSLSVGGSVTVEGNINQTSSIKYKTDIKEFERRALDIIEQVNVVSYKYKTDLKTNHIGFIAEDTPKELSTEDNNVMDIGSCVGVLIKAVQELQEEIKSLKNGFN